ncbi:MAG: S8 family serine peptidase [Bdellovibrionaceae bacterium]|nr:S8 family serine peptidase [Pseudobdellovibrionaceae bacterium]
MNDIGVKDAWSSFATKGSPNIIVGVIDTGVDYTHEDLAANVWRNPGETGVDANGKDKATNGVDDDNNGYIDDVVGWDFAKNDNKPYDVTGGNPFLGGNPGHGTHCAGNIGALADNGKGTVGVAPNIKIMALRFLTEQGQGDIAGAIQAIRYAVDNGAKVLSNSWGSEGDDGEGAPLQEAIQYAQDHGVLFVAAAGNGHNGVGYNNDTDSKPGVPASYSMDNIVSVAALDKNNNRGSFSNWGAKTVDLGAPGVGIYSTLPGNKYGNLDGTSMATPIVAGAAALYWSKNPQATWQDVKNALLGSSRPVNSMKGKSVSGGKLNVKDLMSK